MTGRAIRIVGVSGFAGDPPAAMRRNAEAGPVDAIIGDYLAEFNLAINAIATKQGKHPGWEQTFMDGANDTLEVINAKRLKLVTNGGALNPEGAALEIQKWIDEKGYDLTVAYVTGDNVTREIRDMVAREELPHLDGENRNVGTNASKEEIKHLKSREIVSANCYLGSRAITAALRSGADIVVCGRVADASPVMGLAAWWHDWQDTDFDRLAGALVAGHLIECSGYSTGGNFSGFERYDANDLTDIGFPIAEISSDGSAILTKQETLPGLVNVEVIACQFLYELQGSVYLNSDVKAHLDDITLTQIDRNRVELRGIKGSPPPPTTKCAFFWVDGFQCEYMIAMTGSQANCAAKSDLFKHQTATRLRNAGLIDKISTYEIQNYGTAAVDAKSQFSGTCFLRVFIQAASAAIVTQVIRSHMSLGLEHFSGYHSTIMTNPAQAVPRPYLGYYPGLYRQSNLHMRTALVGGDLMDVPAPEVTEELPANHSYDTVDTVPLSRFGKTKKAEFGTVVLARSGDKGGNINVGFLPFSDPIDHTGRAHMDHWDWLRSFLTRDKLKELMGDDWSQEYSIERVEFPGIRAVHFVIYGILGRGVTSSPVLDNLGKGFADYIRGRHVDVPVSFLDAGQSTTRTVEKL